MLLYGVPTLHRSWPDIHIAVKANKHVSHVGYMETENAAKLKLLPGANAISLTSYHWESGSAFTCTTLIQLSAVSDFKYLMYPPFDKPTTGHVNMQMDSWTRLSCLFVSCVRMCEDKCVVTQNRSTNSLKVLVAPQNYRNDRRRVSLILTMQT